MNSDSFYVLTRGLYALCWALTTTLSLVWMVETVGLDPLQMMLVGAVLEGAVLLFEIPTGVIADAVSRRLSVILGLLLMGAGFLWMALVPIFFVVLCAQVVWGVGATCLSGAWTAWLSAEVGRARASETLLRAAPVAQGAGLAGIALAVALGHVDLAAPLVAGGAGFLVLGLVAALGMRETGFEPVAAGAGVGRPGAIPDALRTVRGQLGARPLLVGLLGVTAIVGAFSEGWDRLYVPLVLERFELPAIGVLDPVVWWGLLAAGGRLAGFVATLLVRRHVDLGEVERLPRILAGLLLPIALLVVAAAFAPHFIWALAAFWLVAGLRSAYGPLVGAWLNVLLPEQGKATMLSCFGQADALGQVSVGPAIGGLARSVGIPAALSVSAAMLLPAAFALRSLGRRARRESDDARS